VRGSAVYAYGGSRILWASTTHSQKDAWKGAGVNFEGGCVSSHKGSRDLNCFRLERGYRAEVKQVTRFGLIAAMADLLGNDLGGRFHKNRTPLVLDELKVRRRQRGSDDNVNLAFRQLKLDELSALLVLACKLLGWPTEPWIHMFQVLRIGNEKDRYLC
jgi:hypothetical protein